MPAKELKPVAKCPGGRCCLVVLLFILSDLWIFAAFCRSDSLIFSRLRASICRSTVFPIPKAVGNASKSVWDNFLMPSDTWFAR
jgi:hypothetical protein